MEARQDSPRSFHIPPISLMAMNDGSSACERRSAWTGCFSFVLYFNPMATKQTRTKKETQVETRSTSTPLAIAWIGIGLLITIILVGLALKSVRVKPAAEKEKPAPSAELTPVQKIGRHLAVPQGENPTIAVIDDPDAMRQNNPTFYEMARVGDILAIWPNLAVLYSVEQDIILAVLPLEIGSSPDAVMETKISDEEMAASVLAEEQKTLKIEVLNGTNFPGLARTASDALEEEGFTTLRPRDARVKNYATTAVVVRTDAEIPETLKFLKDYFGVDATELPEAETVVNGDIVIILGADYQAE